MTGPDQETLKDIFSWANRDVVLRIKFTDGQEYEMTVSGLARDDGKLPHCHGTVIRTLRSKRDWKSDSAIMFQLHEVERVTDVERDEILFQSK